MQTCSSNHSFGGPRDDLGWATHERKKVISRRSFCNLALGGYAASLAPGCATLLTATAPYSNGFARARPEARGVSPQSILAFLDDVQAAGIELHSFML